MIKIRGRRRRMIASALRLQRLMDTRGKEATIINKKQMMGAEEK